MTVTPGEIGIVQHQLEAPDFEAYREAYGTEFIPLTSEQRDDFRRVCDGLVKERKSLNDVCLDLGIHSTKQAILYEPTLFLARPLTPEQTAIINEYETSKVASYCVGVQAELSKVPIQESYERMTHLPDVFAQAGLSASFSEVPFHAACGDWGGKPREFWTRESFANRLIVMGKLLKTVGVELHFEDAFRPVGVQEGLFKRRVAWTQRDHPDWTEDQIITEAQSKTAVKPKLASHKGGAAVDARMIDEHSRAFLDFGHNYPDGGALVFPRTSFVTPEQWRNRQLFQVAAGLSDLTLYVGEDWHVSYGDNLASLDESGSVRPGYVAQYGPIKAFDRTTGAITEVYDQHEADKVFDY